MAPFGLKLWENAFQAIPDISFSNVENFFGTSNGRLPPEDGSVWPQTLGKRVSGDPRHFIFRCPKYFLRQNLFDAKMFSSAPRKLSQQSACFGGAVQVWTSVVNAARKFIGRHIGFSLLGPWRRGKKGKNCFFPELRPKKTYTFSTPEYDGMIIW